jgi:hypothetical protein
VTSWNKTTTAEPSLSLPCSLGCGDPAHAGLDPCDQQGKVRRNYLAALDVYDKKRRVGQIGMDILRPLRLGAMPLLVR